MPAQEKQEDAVATFIDGTLPFNFEKELIENQNKRISVFDTFRANIDKYAAITPKFYAAHDNEDEMQFSEFVRSTGARKSVPQSENHMYGWIPQTIRKKYKVGDLNLIYVPKIRCDLTKFQEKM